MALTKEQIARYSRQLILPEIGPRGQERLQGSAVLIIGAGGLGSPVAFYLAGAGVGTIGIIDRETVAASNLHRQILHATPDVGTPKSRSAKTRLASLNPEVRIVAIQESLEAGNVLQQMQAYDLVVDGSDNFPSRYLVNDACVLSEKPLVHGAVVHFHGQIMTILPRRSACFRCAFPEPPEPGAIPNCQEAGVLGSVAGVLGTLMAHEALKSLLGVGELLTDRLLVFEGTRSRFREVPLRRNLACAVCGETPSITRPVDLKPSCAVGELPRDLRRGQADERVEATQHGGR